MPARQSLTSLYVLNIALNSRHNRHMNQPTQTHVNNIFKDYSLPGSKFTMHWFWGSCIERSKFSI